MHPLVKRILEAQSVILSTHMQPDGDGLGSQVAFYWALRRAGKKVRIINVDAPPRRYQFLNSHDIIEVHSDSKKALAKSDLALIFDTNDPLLLGDLWKDLKQNCKHVAFVDHHPALERHPIHPDENYINTDSSSTGQLVFDMIKALGIPLDKNIATALYASIVFDTNYFRFIRGSPTPHLIAAELLRHDIEPQKIHRAIFGNHTPGKIKFLAQMLDQVTYACEGRLACVRVSIKNMESQGLDVDETRDVIDMVMNIETIDAAVLFREDAPGKFKLSFRSRGELPVNSLAQALGGGGHLFASGAYIEGSFEKIKEKVVRAFDDLIAESPKRAASS